MHRLSDIQEGIFALSQSHYVLTSASNLADQYIDDDQARRIAALSDVKPYTPADEDYPYSIVDSLLLDSDLVLYYGDYSNCFFCAKTRYAYLSRNNISITTFTPTRRPPEIFSVRIRARIPYYGKMVDATSTTLTNHYLHRDVIHTTSGIVKNADVLVIHGCVTVWLHDRFTYIRPTTSDYNAVGYNREKDELTTRAGHYSVKFRNTIDPYNINAYGNIDPVSLYGPYSVDLPVIPAPAMPVIRIDR